MKIAVLKETAPGETRCAAIPETVKKFIALGAAVAVEKGAGAAASVSDADFEAAGAVTGDRKTILAGASAILCINGPDPKALPGAQKGALLVGALDPLRHEEDIAAYAKAGLQALTMEWMPRITRAQSMDILSSQSNLAGYKAVIDAAAAYGRAFPMMMTAAGTVPPARVFIIGAGVAGLQAIATARRIGAIVSATDVRPASKEEIKSLGAAFVGVEDEETAAAQTAGGYAREMSEAFRQKQAELMATTIAKNDVIVCTALVMGRKAPTIVSRAMVETMRPGSVIVDLAAEAGGNCEATVPGERIVTGNGVTILGYRNWPARIPVAASALYARNLLTFLSTFWDKEAQAPKLPDTDDIVKGALLTKGGAVVHPQFLPSQAA